MKKFDSIHLVFIIISSFILIRYTINEANTYPKGSLENIFGNILGLTLSSAIVVCIIILSVLKNYKK